MKRILFLLTGMLIIAMMIFSINSSAQVTDHSTPGTFPRYDDAMRVCEISGNEIVTSRNDPKILDAQPATEFDTDEIKEDGINTRVATVWIVSISAVIFVGIIICVIHLKKKNKI